MLSSGNLSITQNAINTLEQRARAGDNAPNLLERRRRCSTWRGCSATRCARCKTRDGPYLMQNNIDSSANFLVGGQIRGEPPRLFNVYSEGNFIEATPETCYFQIGETKYGKPIIDRVINARHDAGRRHQVHDGVVRLDDALEHLGRAADRPAGLRGRQRCTIRLQRRIEETDPYFQMVHTSGARACAACSRSCPTPTGPERTSRWHPRRAARTAPPTASTAASTLSPHEIRLRPAPHCRTPILGYSLQRRAGRALPQLAAGSVRQLARAARLPRARPTSSTIAVDLVADMTVINPFDFFVEAYAETLSVRLRAGAREGTDPVPRDRAARAAARRVARRASAQTIRPDENTVDLLVRLNQQLQREIALPRAHGAGRADAARRRWSAPAAPAATPPGCWCRSCATWASPRASSPAT